MPLVVGPGFLEPQNLVTHADAAITGAAAAAQILAANASRTTAWIANVGSNGARLGDANTAAAQGVALAAGATIAIETTAAIYAYSASGTTLALMEAVRP
jgi:hypothetical protein